MAGSSRYPTALFAATASAATLATAGSTATNTTAPEACSTAVPLRIRNRVSWYALTSIDHFSRYLLGCQALPDVGGAGVKPRLRRLFRTCGLPDAICSDNGAPFASTGIHGLNRLDVWWLQLGITHQRITPGRPQENGGHERLHKTVKERAARPPAANLNLQQRVFNRFRETYNEFRPPEALDDETPTSR